MLYGSRAAAKGESGPNVSCMSSLPGDRDNRMSCEKGTRRRLSKYQLGNCVSSLLSGVERLQHSRNVVVDVRAGNGSARDEDGYGRLSRNTRAAHDIPYLHA